MFFATELSELETTSPVTLPHRNFRDRSYCDFSVIASPVASVNASQRFYCKIKLVHLITRWQFLTVCHSRTDGRILINIRVISQLGISFRRSYSQLTVVYIFLHILIDLKQPTDVRFATHQSPESLEIEWKRPECGEAGYIDHYIVVACRLADPDCDCRQGHAETSASGKYTRNIIRDITTYLLSYLPCLKNLN